MNIEQVWKRYQAGATLQELGNELGVSRRTVSRRLKAAGYSIRSKSEAASGARNSGWKGGRRFDKSGYVLLHQDGGGYVREHRVVMERQLGRALSANEVVHHINGDRADNRVENLKLCTTRSHRSEHKLSSGTWSRHYDCCVDCGTTERKHAGNGRCTRCSQYRRTVKQRGYECRRDAVGKRIFSKQHRERLRCAARARYA